MSVLVVRRSPSAAAGSRPLRRSGISLFRASLSPPPAGLKETTEQLVKKKLEGRDKLTPWEEYLQKKKEKKKLKKQQKKADKKQVGGAVCRRRSAQVFGSAVTCCF